MNSNARSKARVVVVAGGTGGLGRAVSLAFLEEGSQVAVTYRKREEFSSLKDLAAGSSSRLEGYDADVTDEAAVGKLRRRRLSLGMDDSRRYGKHRGRFTRSRRGNYGSWIRKYSTRCLR